MATDTFELYSLTSKLTLDTAQFDRAYGDSQRKMRTLAGDVKQLESAAKSGEKGVSGLGSALQGLLPSLSSMGGPSGALSIVTAGLGLYAAALTTASVGVWELTKRFSDIGSELKDMSDQVNFSTTTLGTFQGVGKSVGVEVEQLSTGLVTFQKNLAAGNDALKALGVTSKDNEVALRQTFTALSQVNDKTLQTALSQEIFGKSGKAVLAIVKEMGGDFEATQEKLRKWGVLMSDDAIAVADQFGDSLAELGMRLIGIGNIIGQETAPAFIAAFDQIAAALDANEADWRWWGEKVGNIIVNSTALVSGFIHAVSQMGADANPVRFLVDWEAGFREVQQQMQQRRNELLQGSGGAMGGTVPGPSINWKPGGSGRKGKSEAQREAEREARELKRLEEQRVEMIERMNMEYKKLSDQIQGVDVNTRAYAITESQLTGVLEGASEQLIEQAKAIAKNIDSKTKQLALQNQLREFMQEQDEAVKRAIEGEQSHTSSTETFIKSLERQGAVLQEVTKFWLRFNAVLLDANENINRLPENMERVNEAFPLPDVIFPTTPESEIPERAAEAANKEMGLPPEMRESARLKWRLLMEDISYDLSRSITDALEVGFRKGMKAGVVEFGLGILEMVRHEALQELQRAIANALFSGAEGEGGGGIFRQLLSKGIGVLLGALGGSVIGFGGGGSASAAKGGMVGAKAVGGYAPPFSSFRINEYGQEYATAGPAGATVTPAANMVGGNIYMNVYTNDARSFNRSETMTQIRNRLKREMRLAA